MNGGRPRRRKSGGSAGGVREFQAGNDQQAVGRRAWRLLVRKNILILAPRHFGKTGLMRRLVLAPGSGYLPVFLDLDEVDSPEEFTRQLVREALSRDDLRIWFKTRRRPAVLQSWMKRDFDRADFDRIRLEFNDRIRADWYEIAGRIFGELGKADQTACFFLDEFPAMLGRFLETRGESTVRTFLTWFRTVRLDRAGGMRSNRFVIAGSPGLDLIYQRFAEADALQDFVRLTVGPLEARAAGRFASELAKWYSVNWKPELSSRLLELIGEAVPYFMHVFFAELRKEQTHRTGRVTVRDLDRIYRERVLGPGCRHYFLRHGNRLDQYNKAVAFALLRAVAGQERVSRLALGAVYRRCRGNKACEREFDAMLADLEYDWYLSFDPDTREYFFRLKIMRDWWHEWSSETIGMMGDGLGGGPMILRESTAPEYFTNSSSDLGPKPIRSYGAGASELEINSDCFVSLESSLSILGQPPCVYPGLRGTSPGGG